MPLFAADPRVWLVLYDAASADSAAWAESYRASRGVPHANLCGLTGLPAGERLTAAEFTALRGQVADYLDDNALTQVRGVLIGYGVPGVVDQAGALRSLASLLADPSGGGTADLPNPYYAGAGLIDAEDLPSRLTLLNGARRLVAEINAGSLALAQALPGLADALTTVAADDKLVSALDPTADEIALSTGGGAWAELSAWLSTVNRQRTGLTRVSGWDGGAAGGHGYSVEFTGASSGAFGVAGQRKALLATSAAGTADALWSGAGLVRSAVAAGYAFAAGHIGSPSAGQLLNPSALLAALRSGATWAEAIALAAPTLNSTWRVIGDPLAGFTCPRQSFALYRADDASLVSVVPDRTPFGLGLNGVLPEGEWTLNLRRSDRYGSRSEIGEGSTIDVAVDASGNVITRLRAPTATGAETEAGGVVRVRWAVTPRTRGLTDPAGFEVAAAADPATVLTTAAFTGAGAYETPTGPFAHGSTVRLIVRASDGAALPGGVRGPWVSVPAVVADSEGPAPPTIVR